MKTIHIATKWNERGDITGVACESNVTNETLSVEFHQMVSITSGDFQPNFVNLYGKNFSTCRECLNREV